MTNYAECMSAFIKREMVILGKDVPLKIARTVSGIQINDTGTVVLGASKSKLGELVEKFNGAFPLSGVIAKGIVKNLVDNEEDLPDILK